MDEQGVLQSMKDLRALNLSLSHFLTQWDSLQQLLDNISNSIETRSRELDQTLTLTRSPDKKAEQTLAPDNPLPEIKNICNNQGSKALRQFVMVHLSEVDLLRSEIPNAILLAPNPAKLVFDSLGQFYLQGRRAYESEHKPMVPYRHACILILESYVLSGCLPSGKQEVTREAALKWRDRLENEGGIGSAEAIDALGLVLFLAAFGVPSEFSCEDLWDLLRLSNFNEIAHVIGRSHFLLEKIPDVVKYMVSRDMQSEAVDLKRAFRLGEKIDPSHMLDSSEFGFDLHQRITKLQRENEKIEQKPNRGLKRKAEAAGHSNTLETQSKFPWPVAAESSQGQGSSALFHPPKGFYSGLQPHNAVNGGFTGILGGNVGVVGTTEGSRPGSLTMIGGPSYGSLLDGGLEKNLIGRHSVYVLPPPGGSLVENDGLLGPFPGATQGSSQLLDYSREAESRSYFSSLYKFADSVS